MARARVTEVTVTTAKISLGILPGVRVNVLVLETCHPSKISYVSIDGQGVSQYPAVSHDKGKGSKSAHTGVVVVAPVGASTGIPRHLEEKAWSSREWNRATRYKVSVSQREQKTTHEEQ